MTPAVSAPRAIMATSGPRASIDGKAAGWPCDGVPHDGLGDRIGQLLVTYVEAGPLHIIKPVAVLVVRRVGLSV